MSWTPDGNELSAKSCALTSLWVSVEGVHIAHPHHRRRAAGHGDRTVLRRVGTDQRAGRHPLLLSAEHLLQKGNSCSRVSRHASKIA